MQRGQKLAIITQDPANYGGVLRLVEYIYKRAESSGVEPTIIHYGRFSEHPDLNASFANLLRGELNLWPRSRTYEFQGMRAIAIGANLPEWEPNRIRANHLWQRALNGFHVYILITGSAHTGLPIVQCKKPFIAWVSSTVESDRRERLKRERGVQANLERLGLTSVKKAERIVLDAASRILAVSNDAREDISEIARKPIEVAPFPIDTDRFAPSAEPANVIFALMAPSAKSPSPPTHTNTERPSIFFFVGRANDPRKRIDLFFDACDTLRAVHPELYFHARVISQVRPSNEGRTFEIEYRPLVTGEELIGLYTMATALVVTSEQEGLGIAAMEAMACGLPVISTRCGGPETFIDDTITGFLVHDTPEAIAERMFDIATNTALWERMTEASRQRIVTAFSETVWNPFFDTLI